MLLLLLTLPLPLLLLLLPRVHAMLLLPLLQQSMELLQQGSEVLELKAQGIVKHDDVPGPVKQGQEVEGQLQPTALQGARALGGSLRRRSVWGWVVGGAAAVEACV